MPSSPVEVSLSQLLALQYQVNKVSAQRGKIRSLLSGGHLSHFRGRGMEFEEVRVYQPGDDVGMIDWKVTARKGTTHTKIFREERERPVLLCVDYRPSMFFATQGMLKSVMAARMAACLAWQAVAHGDRVGLSLLSQHEAMDIKPKRGRKSVLRCLHGLCTSKAWQRDAAQGHDEDFSQWLHRLRHLAPTGSLVYVLSDFRGLDDAAEAHLALLARHHEVGLVHIYDAMEAKFPEGGAFPVFDGQHYFMVHATPQMRHDLYAQFEQRCARLQRIQQQYGAHLMTMQTHDDVVRTLQEHVWQR